MSERLSTRQAAEILGVSIRSVQYYMKDGKLRSRKDENGRNRFSRKDVEALRETLRATDDSSKEEGARFRDFDPKTFVLLDRKTYEEQMQRHEGLLVRLGQLEAELRSTQKLLEDMRAPTTVEAEPIEATITQAPPESTPPQQHPAHGSQEGTQRLQDDWRKFIHAPASIGPVDDPRPFWTAPVQKQEKPWWKRIFKK